MLKFDSSAAKKVGISVAFALMVLAASLLLITGIYLKNMGACVVGGIMVAISVYVAITWFFKEFKENN